MLYCYQVATCYCYSLWLMTVQDRPGPACIACHLTQAGFLELYVVQHSYAVLPLVSVAATVLYTQPSQRCL